MTHTAKIERIPLRNDGGDALEPAALPPVRVEADVGLLPCPFCGGRAEMNLGGFGECFVTCADDNCGGRLGTGIWFTTAAQAMDVWNRRPNTVSPKANA